MEQRLLIELSPPQLLLPHPDGMPLFIAAGLLTGLQGGTPGLTRAEGAHTQRRTQIRRAHNAREVAVGLVAEQGPITERPELLQSR